MEELPWILWWTQDDVAASWFRTSVAAVFGVIAGGLFTMWGQSRGENAQLIRDLIAREGQLDDARRQALEVDMRALHSLFTDLLAKIDRQPESLGQILGSEPWNGEWKQIWTSDVRSKARLQSDLIPDQVIRAHVIEIVGFLNDAREHSWEGFWPGAPGRNLRHLTGMLTAEAIETLSAYLRRDPHVTRRSEFLQHLRDEKKQQDEWEDREVERSERQAEEWQENATPEEIKRIDDMANAFELRRRAGAVPSVDSAETSAKVPEPDPKDEPK